MSDGDPKYKSFQFDDLGITIRVTFQPILGEALGHADQATGEIVIEEDLEPLGHVCVLIHEMLHLAEGTMLAEGVITEPINHDFITAASAGVAIALARAGMLRDIQERHIQEFKEADIGETRQESSDD
jgi:hypothetical protein